jgi:hypothetical protein
MPTADSTGNARESRMEERWTLWIAKGAANDRVAQRYALLTVAVAVVGLASWLAYALA